MNLTEWAHYSFSFLLSQSVAFHYLLLETQITNRLKIDLERHTLECSSAQRPLTESWRCMTSVSSCIACMFLDRFFIKLFSSHSSLVLCCVLIFLIQENECRLEQFVLKFHLFSKFECGMFVSLSSWDHQVISLSRYCIVYFYFVYISIPHVISCSKTCHQCQPDRKYLDSFFFFQE